MTIYKDMASFIEQDSSQHYEGLPDAAELLCADGLFKRDYWVSGINLPIQACDGPREPWRFPGLGACKLSLLMIGKTLSWKSLTNLLIDNL